MHHNIHTCYLVTSYVYVCVFACARQGNDCCPASRSTQSHICYQGEYVHIGMAKFTAADGDNQLIESNVVSEYLDVQYRSVSQVVCDVAQMNICAFLLHESRSACCRQFQQPAQFICNC